jgi:hypothetical protein
MRTLKFSVLGDSRTFQGSVKRPDAVLSTVIQRIAEKANLAGGYEAISARRGVTLDPNIKLGDLKEEDEQIVLSPTLTPAATSG